MSHDVRATRSRLGQLPDGRAVDLFELRNSAGVEARISTYGGTLMSLRTPDRKGLIEDVVLGVESVVRPPQWPYFGALIGRYANRIANGRFTLDGQPYGLTTNNGAHQLHGGTVGWDQAVWSGDPFENADAAGVRLTHVSPDGDQGYPGTVTATVTYTLDRHSALTVEFHATTDRPTVVNLTHHSYFNLSGSRAATILGHELTINADRYTPIDATGIPTGELAPVANTPFDFRRATKIGARIDEPHEQLAHGHGYDHNFVINRKSPGMAAAVHLVDRESGRTLDIHTTAPGIQVYSGNHLDGSIAGKYGRPYIARAGVSLEPQSFPDAPNHPAFPSTTLRPGEDYRVKSVFTFGVV